MASENVANDDMTKAIATCANAQNMIDLQARHLEGLRTRCATTEEITQNAIRKSEVKIIKLFSEQLVAKASFKLDNLPSELKKYPNTDQWLKIVGVQLETRKCILARGLTLERLVEMSHDQLDSVMKKYGASKDSIHSLTTALRHLKTWTDLQLSEDTPEQIDIELHWSSYKSASNSPYGGNSPKLPPRPPYTPIPAEPTPQQESPQSPKTPSSPLHTQSPGEHRRRYTPPATPNLVNKTKGKFPTTPPPQTKNKLHPESPFPLTKSTSHESQLANKIVDVDNIGKYLQKKPDNLTLSQDQIYNRRRKSAESVERSSHSGQMSPLVVSSPKRSPPYKTPEQNSIMDYNDVHSKKKFNVNDNMQLSNQLMVPVSPRTVNLTVHGGVSMMHAINHRFTSTLKITTCDYCQKQMFIGYKCKECKFQTRLVWDLCGFCHRKIKIGKVCRDCKFKVHKECASKAAPACGLPSQYLDYYIQTTMNGSPHLIRRPADHSMSLPSHQEMRNASSVPAFQAPDSSSNTSSCNSSTPSSPALYNTPNTPCMSPAHRSPQIQITPDVNTQFQFPDCTDTTSSYDTLSSRSGLADSVPTNHIFYASLDRGPSDIIQDVVNTNTSNDSDKSDKTLIDSNQSGDQNLLERADSRDADEGGHTWHREASISLKEWDIPFEELIKGEMIGEGRFGTVYKGNWHGDVAIKMLNMDPDQEKQAQLIAFKQEVATLKKTRHENLVLFMGACMKPPHLAIVTSLCKGETLYKKLHGERFQFNKIVIVASQIAQGMGYLHAKGILHKDLKTKNVFLEAGRVIITDFGLCNVTKMCHGTRRNEWLPIPKGWLCYLSPEIIRSLQPGGNYMRDMDLPFSEASDIYAFGTVWYELLTGEWPFRTMHPEVIIWQVGKGVKQSLSNIHASRDVKDLLMLCWSYKTDDRPNFAVLLKTLERLPKKRLARSPSHPVQLSRSAESVI